MHLACLRQAFTQSVVPVFSIACRQGGQKGKEGCSLYSCRGVESLCHLTPSPPNTPPIYGASAINVYANLPRQRRQHLRRLRRKRLQQKCFKLPTTPLLALPTLKCNRHGVYGTFHTRVLHVYGSGHAHSAPQRCVKHDSYTLSPEGGRADVGLCTACVWDIIYEILRKAG